MRSTHSYTVHAVENIHKHAYVNTYADSALQRVSESLETTAMQSEFIIAISADDTIPQSAFYLKYVLKMELPQFHFSQLTAQKSNCHITYICLLVSTQGLYKSPSMVRLS